jgi:hypothetical protein
LARSDGSGLLPLRLPLASHRAIRFFGPPARGGFVRPAWGRTRSPTTDFLCASHRGVGPWEPVQLQKPITVLVAVATATLIRVTAFASNSKQVRSFDSGSRCFLSISLLQPTRPTAEPLLSQNERVRTRSEGLVKHASLGVFPPSTGAGLPAWPDYSPVTRDYPSNAFRFLPASLFFQRTG